MAVESYSQDQDQRLARQRWQELGPDAPDILNELQASASINSESILIFRNLVNAPVTIETSTTDENTSKKPTTIVTKEQDKKVNPVILLVGFCLLTLVIGAVLFFVVMARRRLETRDYISDEFLPTDDPSDEFAGIQENGMGQSVAQFMTTYAIGDDLYDDSYSIDSPTGEFLGECGVGISETIGVGEPKKITAFEVWLFDKNDIQTVTKVFMSEYALNDSKINQKLASKGEPVLIEPGKRILLETATLQLEARVVDMIYGQGSMPEKSHFERLTLELVVWKNK